MEGSLAMTQDNILTTIQNLFAMAEHETSNENEAAVALQKAQDLLLKHNLSRANIDTAPGIRPVNDAVGKVEVNAVTGWTWRKTLLHVIARNNLCKVIGDNGAKTAHLFGRQDNVRSVLEMYYWVGDQLQKMAPAAFRMYKADGGRETARTFNAGFFQGACRTIDDRLEKPLEDFKAGSGRSVVLASDTSLKDAVGRVFPHTRTSRSTTRMGDGYVRGKAAGNNVRFGQAAQLGGRRRALGAG